MVDTGMMNNFKPTIPELESAFDSLECENPMLLMNYPNNPTG